VAIGKKIPDKGNAVTDRSGLFSMLIPVILAFLLTTLSPRGEAEGRSNSSGFFPVPRDMSSGTETIRLTDLKTNETAHITAIRSIKDGKITQRTIIQWQSGERQEEVAVMAMSASLMPRSYTKQVKDKQGNTSLETRVQFDIPRRLATITHRSGKSDFSERIDIPAGCYVPMMTWIALQGVTFSPGERYGLHILALISDPKVYRMEIKVLGTEQVNVPSGSFDCYKMEMKHNFGRFRNLFADRVAPRTYFWYEATPPHRFVKYQGVSYSDNRKTVIYELVESAAPSP